VGLAAGGLDNPLEIHEMVVRRHGVLFAEHFVGAAVVPNIDQNEQVVAADAGFDNPLAVSGGEPGAFRLHHKGVVGAAAFVRPFGQVCVDFFAQFPGALQGDDA
jgi:hypothetical protein